LWGSDWPFLRASERIDYGPLLRLVEVLLPTPADRRKLLWDTPPTIRVPRLRRVGSQSSVRTPITLDPGEASSTWG
jgi:hypothetical protein